MNAYADTDRASTADRYSAGHPDESIVFSFRLTKPKKKKGNMLTKKEILLILERIGEKTVVEPSKEFPYRVSCEGRGWSDDKQIGSLQAKLSIMLEAARD